MNQLFAKIFASVFDSSIADDWQVRHVFQDLLILADKTGIVDMTAAAISRRTNVPLEIVLRALPVLESEDPTSRSPEHRGRRILRIDPHRDWGWRVVNFEKYRESATREMLRMVEADRKRAYRERHKLGARRIENNKSPSPIPPTFKNKNKRGDMSEDMSGTSPPMSATERITYEQSLRRVLKRLDELKGGGLLPTAAAERKELIGEAERLRQILGVKV